MPQTRNQWYVFTMGLCAIVVFGVLVALKLVQQTSAASPAATRLTRSVVHQTIPAAPIADAVATKTVAQGAISAVPSTPVVRHAVRVHVSAPRGDSWLVAREASATGRLLYNGTLPQGQSVHWVVRRAVWLQVGAGSNLDAHVNGKPVPLLFGTFTALLTRAGLAPAP
jgi:hypothetical protein